ncbi:class I SAM-dependent methyltransferase [Chitinophaga oryzae]|uniref:Class I SAM-dependent methyltransferase n=1 Tax=Chitinophaga oryzae TaxID=2725414 RepID=A0AAE6ZG01_9BACT|nr:class I SAM-dependent methyltransferase [Chitinophaga oryzae]QJB32360.1 class I SAM-dependent methyltransferase [Chitinophaga oryzae]
MKNTERFSNKVDNYVKYRPHYPVAIIPYLVAEAGLTHQSVIADIGSGTGISTTPFLDNGNIVYAVEPNKEMREAAEKLLLRYPNFRSVTGTAERTTLPDDSVDLIIAGQAFHWFDKEAAGEEFRRIAKQNACVVLMWNIRQTNTPFEQAYEDLLHRHGIDYKDMKHRNISPAQLGILFAQGSFREKTFQNVQRFDFPALKGRLTSSSYMPDKTNPGYAAMVKDLEDIFEKYQENGMVLFRYETKLYTGLIADTR